MGQLLQDKVRAPRLHRGGQGFSLNHEGLGCQTPLWCLASLLGSTIYSIVFILR